MCVTGADIAEEGCHSAEPLPGFTTVTVNVSFSTRVRTRRKGDAALVVVHEHGTKTVLSTGSLCVFMSVCVCMRFSNIMNTQHTSTLKHTAARTQHMQRVLFQRLVQATQVPTGTSRDVESCFVMLSRCCVMLWEGVRT